MSIINRRNALFGWLAWKLAKAVGKRQATKKVSGENGRKGMSAALAASIAAAAGALIFWRRRRADADRPAEDAP